MRSIQPGSTKHVLRKVVGLVLIVPLLISLTPIPFGLWKVAALAALTGSVYGCWLARRQGSRGLTVFAVVTTLLNCLSLVALSTPSMLMGLWFVAWAYGSGSWIHWPF